MVQTVHTRRRTDRMIDWWPIRVIGGLVSVEALALVLQWGFR